MYRECPLSEHLIRGARAKSAQGPRMMRRSICPGTAATGPPRVRYRSITSSGTASAPAHTMAFWPYRRPTSCAASSAMPSTR
jgi:hypothetical protein